jgi:hypothetical protein
MLCWCSCLPRCGAGVPAVQDLFARLSYPEGIREVDRASADLTSREAVDLSWALDIWRESGAHWPGEPAAPDRAAQSPEPPTKPRRPRS